MFIAVDNNMEGRKISDHSLRVGFVTSTQDIGYDNFYIMSRSGHRSQAIDVYKRQTVKRKQAISRQLDLPHTVSNLQQTPARAEQTENKKLEPTPTEPTSASLTPHDNTTHQLVLNRRRTRS